MEYRREVSPIIFAVISRFDMLFVPYLKFVTPRKKGNIKSIAFLEWTSGYTCIVSNDGICAVKPEAVFGRPEQLKDKIQGVLIPTGSALLPKELEKSDRSTLLLALAANAASI
ncbi:hypothetical protein ACTXT7_016186 [Hymenolepis weldensis]